MEQVNDLTRPIRTTDWIEVAEMPEIQRLILLQAKAIERQGRLVTSRELGAKVYGEETTRNSQKAASSITVLRRKGIWPWKTDGTNGVPTTKRLIWPELEPVPAPDPDPSKADRQMALRVLGELLDAPETTRAQTWQRVKDLIDPLIDG